MRVDSNQQKIVKNVALKKEGIQRFSFFRFSTLIQWENQNHANKTEDRSNRE
jgi:hypothetical protein